MEQIQLRGYQNECIEGIRTAIGRGFKTMACVLPTGSGKTTIFGSIVSRYLDRNAGKRAVVISHLGLLTSQTAERFGQEYGVRAGVLQANKTPAMGERCVITTMQSFRDENKRLRLSRNSSWWCQDTDDIGLIIIDECHFAGCKSYQEIIEAYPNAIIIGFTATPFRQNKLMTNMFQCVAYTCSMKRLINEGHLVEPVLNQTPFDTTDQADMLAKMIEIYKEKHNGHKAVIYLKTIEEAKLARNILVASGITADAVTSQLTGNARDELLKEFRNGGGPDILTTVDVLTAGFDSPNLRALFIPYKVGSVTTYLQRVGRGLRPYERKKHCDIYVGSNSPGIEEGYWEKINQRMLNQGRDPASYDSYEDIAEYAENDMSQELYKWTLDVIKMAKSVKSLGMNGLFEMIVSKKLPEDMLNIMIAEAPTTTKKGATTKMSEKQEWFLKSKGIYAEGLTKQEASAMINAHKRANGWEPNQAEIVQSGKHKGKHFSQVPPAYWGVLAKKFPFSPTYKEYKRYKENIRR